MKLCHHHQLAIKLHKALVESTQKLWYLEDMWDSYYWQTHCRVSARLQYMTTDDSIQQQEHWQAWLLNFEQKHQRQKSCFRQCLAFYSVPYRNFQNKESNSLSLDQIPNQIFHHQRLLKRWIFIHKCCRYANVINRFF